MNRQWTLLSGLLPALASLPAGHAAGQAGRPGPSPWPTVRGNSARTAVSGQAGARSGEQTWDLEKEGVSGAVVAADGTVYLGAKDGTLSAISPAGEEKWCCDDVSVSSNPAIGPDGTVYALHKLGELAAVAPDGTLKWKCELETGGIPSDPVPAADGTVYVVCGSQLHAVSPGGAVKWKLPVGEETPAPAIAPDGTAYLGKMQNPGGSQPPAGQVTAVAPDGQIRWQAKLDGSIGSPIVGPDGTLYALATLKAAGCLYALDTAGKVKWSCRFAEMPAMAAPSGGPSMGTGFGGLQYGVGEDGTAYVGLASGTLVAVNPQGKEKWKFSSGGGGMMAMLPAAVAANPQVLQAMGAMGGSVYGPAIGGGQTIFVGAGNQIGDSALCALNPDGSLKWRREVRGRTVTAIAVGKGITLCVTDQGVYAFE